MCRISTCSTLSVFFMFLTFVRTETPFLVVIVVVSSAAPQFAISSSLTSAGVVLLTQEYKGEVAGLSLRVSTNYSGVCPNRHNSKETSHYGSVVQWFIMHCSSFHSPRLGQKPYFLSWSKLDVVAHQR